MVCLAHNDHGASWTAEGSVAQLLAAPAACLLMLQVKEHAGLREREIGILQGLTNKEAPLQQPEAWAVLQSGDHSALIPGGGESLDDLKQRLSETLLDIAAQYPGGCCTIGFMTGVFGGCLVI
jgi:broad specificity phosphatase PhoE